MNTTHGAWRRPETKDQAEHARVHVRGKGNGKGASVRFPTSDVQPPASIRRAKPAVAAVVCLFALTSVFAYGQELVVIGYNVQSGDAEAAAVAERIEAIDGCDIWGLCEVEDPGWADAFELAAEDGEDADFQQILGTTGGADKLLIIYDSERLEMLESQELSHINIGGHVRAPLVAKFKLSATGTEFLFVVNHLYRTRAERRHMQAALLNDWAAGQQLPVVAVGDYNFDWSVTDGETDHDEGYDELTANAVFEWVRPAELVMTQDSDHNSILDFVFASRDAKHWAVGSTILSVPNDFPDTDETSDHRPVRATFNLAQRATVSKQDILDRIRRLKEQLEALERLVEQLP